MAVTRVAHLADEERTRFDEWADRWIDIGLRTDPADRARFEAAVRDCYRFAGIDWPDVVVWVPSPLVLAFAAPTAALAIELDGAVGGAVDGAVGGAVDGAWWHYIGGQFWVGGWWRWSPSYTSFFREVCRLELPGDLWERGKAYEATAESACWWWPHRRFVMVCERPLAIHRELADPEQPRGRGSHRLHCDDGPAVVWPDGWGVWSVHGVRVPRQVVEAPETLTVDQITGEANVEVRRIMLERFGQERYLQEAGAKKLHADDWGTLWRATLFDDDEDLVMVQVTNSSPEPDGSYKDYWLRVPPAVRTAHQAVAWTFGEETGDYEPVVQT